MKNALTILLMLTSIALSAQENQSIFLDNNKFIYFRNANGENDGVRLGRHSGDGLRMRYKGNNFAFDALDNKAVLFKNSSDQNKAQIHPAGVSYFNGGNVGIGKSDPQSKLHISNGFSGNTPHSFSDLTIEDDEHGMISILTPTDKIGYYGFGDADDNFVGGVQYDHTTDKLHFRVNNRSSDLTLNSSGMVGIGLTAPLGKLHIKSNNANDFLILDRKGRPEIDNLIYLTPSWDNDQNDQLRFNIGTNNVATFEETGNVGIGLVNPTSKLHVFKNGGGLDMNLQTNSDDAVRLYFTGASQQWSLRKLNNNDFIIADETSGYKTPFRIEPGAGNNTFRIESNGNVGIGVVDPSEKLEVAGTTKITHPKAEAIRFYYPSATQGQWQAIGSNTSGDLILSAHGTIAGSEHLTIHQSNGSVGIGTGSNGTGTHMLAVEGSIGAREIKVEATGWSDFVFANDYKLPSLDEVEKFIAANNHLPEIPSEAEVLEDGINLGEMNAKLLQKIEELTLYLIEQNKRIITLEEKLAEKE